jgi:hypothetical protein
MFICDAFKFNSMIVTLSSSFQTLLKEAEATDNENVDVGVGTHIEQPLMLRS